MYRRHGHWLFFSTMKNATHSMYEALKSMPGVKWAGHPAMGFHSLPMNINHQGLAVKKIRLEPIQWTVVRNPYSRAVSIWSSTCVRGDAKYQQWRDAITAAGGDHQSFKDFVKHILIAKPRIRVPQLYWPQHQWIGKVDCDCTIQLEHLARELNDKLGIQLKIPTLNRSDHKHWTEYYKDDEGLAILVQRWAGDDFERYGYERAIRVARGGTGNTRRRKKVARA